MTCEECGEDSIPRFCGSTCRNRYIARTRRPRADPGWLSAAARVLACDECGERFETRHPKARFCKVTCRGKFHARALRRRRGMAAVPQRARKAHSGWCT